MEIQRFDMAGMTEVVVGVDHVKFLIHSDLFRARSTFFKVRLSETWGTKEQPITLPDVDSMQFNLYLALVWGSAFAKDIKVSDRVVQLSRLWALADRFGDCKSANIIMDEIIARISETIAWDVFKNMMTDLPPASLLYKLLVDLWLYEGGEIIDTELCLEESSEDGQEARAFLVAIAKAYRKTEINASSKDTIETTFRTLVGDRDRTQYHMHDSLCPKNECHECVAWE